MGGVAGVFLSRHVLVVTQVATFFYITFIHAFRKTAVDFYGRAERVRGRYVHVMQMCG